MIGASGGGIKSGSSGAGLNAHLPTFDLLHMLTEVLHDPTNDDKAMTGANTGFLAVNCICGKHYQTFICKSNQSIFPDKEPFHCLWDYPTKFRHKKQAKENHLFVTFSDY